MRKNILSQMFKHYRKAQGVVPLDFPMIWLDQFLSSETIKSRDAHAEIQFAEYEEFIVKHFNANLSRLFTDSASPSNCEKVLRSFKTNTAILVEPETRLSQQLPENPASRVSRLARQKFDAFRFGIFAEKPILPSRIIEPYISQTGELIFPDHRMETDQLGNINHELCTTALLYISNKDSQRLFSLLRAYPQLVQPDAALNYYPLHLAAMTGDAATCHLLLNLGSDPNAKDAEGFNALVLSQDLATFELLRTNGVDINNESNNGLNVLDIAARKGDFFICQRICSDPEFSGSLNNALFAAVDAGTSSSTTRIPIILLLLINGAKKLSNNEGKTFLDYVSDSSKHFLAPFVELLTGFKLDHRNKRIPGRRQEEFLLKTVISHIMHNEVDLLELCRCLTINPSLAFSPLLFNENIGRETAAEYIIRSSLSPDVKTSVLTLLACFNAEVKGIAGFSPCIYVAERHAVALRPR